MTQHWIDFREVKERADFRAVLAHYELKMSGRGDQLTGLCPFHKETKPSFKVNLTKRAFHCFGCDAKGNVLDFVKRMEGGTLREAAEKIGEICGFEARGEPPPKEATDPNPRAARPDGAKESGSPRAKAEPSSAEEGPNSPLTFTLKLDPSHPYLAKRGVRPEVVEAFGLGFASRGLLKDRIAIPIHDDEGNLVAYAGRYAADPAPGDLSKYLLPPKFKKLDVLYNLNRAKGEELIAVVEGYFGVFRLHDLGLPAVALMGHVLSREHVNLLTRCRPRHLLLMLDGDEPGREAAAAMLPRLAERFFVRLVTLPDGLQPDTTPSPFLEELIRSLKSRAEHP